MQEQPSPFHCLTHKLPLDQQGFTQSFSIHNFDPQAVLQFYQKYGLVIFDDVLNEEEISRSIDDLWEDVIESSQGNIKRNDSETWDWTGPLGRFGFINDKPLSRPQLWKNRAHPNTYKAFKSLYQITSQTESLNEPLLCLFDRASILRPSKLNADWETSPLHHFDIYPWWWTNVEKDSLERWRNENYYDESFSCWLGEGNYVPKVKNYSKLQGVLAFSDTHPTSGGFECVCGFQNCIKEWCEKYPPGTRITRSIQLMQNMQRCYQRKGSLLIFSRQLPHNIFPNRSENFRYAQYMRMAPESILMLTKEEKEVRKREVKKMLPAYFDTNNDICREVFMLDEEKVEEEQKVPGNAKKKYCQTM